MFRFPYSLFWFLIIAFIPNFQSLYGQTFTLNNQGLRTDFDFVEGTQIIALCGLEPGQEYGFRLAGDNYLSNPVFLSVKGGELLKEGPNPYFIKAEKTCVELTITFQKVGLKQTLPKGFSSWCRSCPKETQADRFVSFAQLDFLIYSVLMAGAGCWDVRNATQLGTGFAMGLYSGTPGSGIGMMMSTGVSTAANGPNNLPDVGTDHGLSGDLDLTGMTMGFPPTFDANVVHFDFTAPYTGFLTFTVVFASEEYPAGNCDAFGIFASGAGITGPFSNNSQNYAILPGSSYNINACEVSENNNAIFYVDNTMGSESQFDGYTIPMTVRIPIIECEDYHIKIAIADTGDGLYDSGIFIQGNTFGYEQAIEGEVVVESTQSNITYEACSDAVVRVCRVDKTNLFPELYVDYTILPSSTATLGLDYLALPPTFVIPAGEACVDVPLQLIPDLIPEGDEFLNIELVSPCECLTPTVEIIIRDTPPFDMSVPDITVCQDDFLYLEPEITSGVPDYDYQWSDGSTDPALNFDAEFPGSSMYTVTVTDGCGRSRIDSALVVIHARPTATMEGDGYLCVGSNKDTINITVTFGPPGTAPWTLSYYLNGVLQPILSGITQSPLIIPVTTPGYSEILAVTNNTVCDGYIYGSSFIEPIKILATLDSTPVSCFGLTDGTLTAQGLDGEIPYTYTWSVGGQTGPLLDSVGVGQYFVTVTDFKGCTAVDSITMNSQTDIDVAGILVNGTACNTATGAVDLSVSGGTLPYSFLWSNGSSLEDPANLPEGTVTVTVTDDRGCESYASFDIPVPAAPSISASPMGIVTCAAPAGGSAILDIQGGTMPFTFLWSGNGGNQQNPTGLTGGIYTVTVTDDAGCVAVDTIIVPVDTLSPVAIAIPTDTLTCGVTYLSLNGLGSTIGSDIIYQWATSNGQILNGGSTLQPEIGLPGIYSLVVTNTTNGCTASATVQIHPDLNAPTIQIGPVDTLSCNVSTVVLDASGSTTGPNIQISWMTSNGVILSGGSTLQPTVGSTGTYTLILTNTTNNCVATEDILVPGLNALIEAKISAPGMITCDMQQVTLDGMGSTFVPGSTFNWSTTNGNIQGSTTSISAQATAAGNYSLIVTDPASGCADTISVNVVADLATPTAAALADGMITCDQTSVSLDGNGSSPGPNIQYLWTTSNGNLTGTPQSKSTTCNAPGTYTLLVTNTQNGCTAQTTVNVQIDTLTPQANAGVANQLDCQNAVVTLQGSGQTFSGSATIIWTTVNGNILNGATSFTPQVNQAGTYQLLITDNQNGCTAQSSVTILDDFNLPNIVIAPPAVLTCAFPETTLNATGSASGPQITIQWNTSNGTISSGAGTYSPTVTKPGNYTLLLIDTSNGCRDSLSVTVSEDKIPPSADAGMPEQIACLGDSALLDGTASTIGSNITHDWYLDLLAPPVIANQVSAFTTLAGTYTLIVTNQQNGCRDSSYVKIPSDFLNDAVLTLIDKTCNDQVSDLQIGPVAGGVEPYIYSIDGGLTTQIDPLFRKLAPGTYNVVVTDGKGCTWSENIDVPVEEGITITLPADLTITLSETVTIEALINVDPGTLTSITWYPAYGLDRTDSLTITANPSITVPYTITLTDERGCIGKDTISVIVLDPDIFIPSAFTPYNGDGANDLFMVFAGDVGIEQIDRLEVYSRWGERLFLAENFQPNDPTFGWDGMQQGRELNPGVFVYYAQVRFTDGRVQSLKGEVLLMR